MSPDPHLTALELHLQQKRHFHVSRDADSSLHRWAIHQRQLWRLGQIDYQIELSLRTLGFPLEVEDCEWEIAFAPLVYYFKHQGRLPLPGTRPESWLQEQRRLHHAGTLPRNREERLKAIGVFDQPSVAHPVGIGRLRSSR